MCGGKRLLQGAQWHPGRLQKDPVPLAPVYTRKAAPIHRVIAKQPKLTGKPQSKIMYWIICRFSPFRWHFSTCFYVVSILFWASGLTETQATGDSGVQPQAVGPGWHHRYVYHLEQWVLSQVTSTDTTMMQRSDGNNSHTRVRTSFALHMGLHRFLWISGQIPNAAPAFRLPQLPQWLSALFQVAVVSTPLGTPPVPRSISVLPGRLPRPAVSSTG